MPFHFCFSIHPFPYAVLGEKFEQQQQVFEDITAMANHPVATGKHQVESKASSTNKMRQIKSMKTLNVSICVGLKTAIFRNDHFFKLYHLRILNSEIPISIYDWIYLLLTCNVSDNATVAKRL